MFLLNILNITEAEEYFLADKKSVLTSYAKECSEYYAEENDNTCLWRLCSPIDHMWNVAVVDYHGTINSVVEMHSANIGGVRPAMWTSLTD